jgi:hypothetical protein
MDENNYLHGSPIVSNIQSGSGDDRVNDEDLNLAIQTEDQRLIEFSQKAVPILGAYSEKLDQIAGMALKADEWLSKNAVDKSGNIPVEVQDQIDRSTHLFNSIEDPCENLAQQSTSMAEKGRIKLLDMILLSIAVAEFQAILEYTRFRIDRIRKRAQKVK